MRWHATSFSILAASALVATVLWFKLPSKTTARVLHASVVHASDGCDASSLNTTYGYTLQGFYFDNRGGLNFLSAAGAFVADGQGNLTGKETDSFSGTVIRSDTYAGSYTVNSDCTGTLTTNSQTVGTSIYDFVLTNNGNTLQMVEADSGTNVSGSARKQTIATTVPVDSGS